MWVAQEKAQQARDVVQKLSHCIRQIPLSQTHRRDLDKFLGTNKCVPQPQQLPSRELFDALMAQLLSVTALPIPTKLNRVILAVRHALPLRYPQPLSNHLRVVCLFPVSAAVDRKAMGTHYQFDGGWCTDGLFLWLGQEQRKGHLEVINALEDCCNSYQAVLLFTRTSQGSRHTFVGRARGFLPVADQQPEHRQPYRAALMMDVITPFRFKSDEGDFTLHPGHQVGQPTKAAVHSLLCLKPPNQYRYCGYSVSTVNGECQIIQSPLSVICCSV